MTGATLAAVKEARSPGSSPPPLAAPAKERGRELLRPGLIFLAFGLVPFLAALTAERYLLDLAARVMIFAVATVALDLLVGYCGLISFGHAAFIGLGAYAVGILAAA